MNILILHNAYQLRGGEETVVAAEAELLRGAGHNVHTEIVSNAEISGPLKKARVFFSTPYDIRRKLWVRELVGRVKPDLVHIHNFFPLLTPAVHEALTEIGLPVVQTLHNYRLLCAGAQFLREGKVCEKCLHGSRAWGVVHRCYKNSLPGSLALVMMQERSFRQETWSRHVHRFIALTEFSRQKMIEGGLPSDRIMIKPNFSADSRQKSAARAGALYVGRLSREKGVASLISAWKDIPYIPLTIVGDGPERARLERAAPENVQFVGEVPADEVGQLMSRANCLVMPSVWYETFGLSMIEAFAHGLPVVASRLGAMAEIVIPGRNGEHFRPGDPDDLRDKVLSLLTDPERLATLSEGARHDFEEKYTPARNLDLLMAVYEEARRASTGKL